MFHDNFTTNIIRNKSSIYILLNKVKGYHYSLSARKGWGNHSKIAVNA